MPVLVRDYLAGATVVNKTIREMGAHTEQDKIIVEFNNPPDTEEHQLTCHWSEGLM